MKDDDERRLVSNVLAQGMRRERSQRGRTLGDVAEASQKVGLKWDQAALSHIETGKRQLTFEEFIALPIVMTMACGEPVTYGDLLNLGDIVDDRGEVVATGRLASWLAESQRAVWPGEEWDQLREFVAGDVQVAVREVQAAQVPDEEASSRELRRYAERLGVPLGAVIAAIGELVEADQWLYHFPRWERERRLVESGEDLSQSGRIRVLRGHITRQLEREIAGKMKEQDGEAEEGPDRMADPVSHPRG